MMFLLTRCKELYVSAQLAGDGSPTVLSVGLSCSRPVLLGGGKDFNPLGSWKK